MVIMPVDDYYLGVKVPKLFSQRNSGKSAPNYYNSFFVGVRNIHAKILIKINQSQPVFSNFNRRIQKQCNQMKNIDKRLIAFGSKLIVLASLSS